MPERQGSRHQRGVIGLLIAGAIVGACVAFLGYWEALAFIGAGTSLPGLPDRDPAIVRLYPGFGGSPWPSAAVFVVGALFLAIALASIRLNSNPQLGGRLIWRGVLIAGVGIALHFSGIVVAGAGDTGSYPLPLLILGLAGVIVAVCVVIAGLKRLARERAVGLSHN
jgi:hypothetical protein